MRKRKGCLSLSIYLVILVFFLIKENEACICSGTCSGCLTAGINGKPCGDTLFCTDQNLFLSLDENSGLILRRAPANSRVASSHANLNCKAYGLKYAEFAFADYYDFIAPKIISAAQSVAGYSMSSPFYVKLNINGNQLFSTLGKIVYPSASPNWVREGCSISDKQGIKIVLQNGSVSSIQVGCFDKITYNSILCLSSFYLTTIINTSAPIVTCSSTDFLLDIQNKSQTLSNPLKYLRSQTIVLTGKLNYMCINPTNSLSNQKYWRVYQVSRSTGSIMTEIAIDSTNPTQYNSELVMQPNTLNYALYKIVYHVEIDKTLKTSFTYIDVLPTGISIYVYPNRIERVEIGNQQSIQLDPITYSIDIDKLVVFSNLVFKFYCKPEDPGSITDFPKANGNYIDLLAFRQDSNLARTMNHNYSCFDNTSELFNNSCLKIY
jgi:hypothetical protein